MTGTHASRLRMSARREFAKRGLNPQITPRICRSSIFLRRIVGESLPTWPVSRHTFSAQAAGAGSHQPKSRRNSAMLLARAPSAAVVFPAETMKGCGRCAKPRSGSVWFRKRLWARSVRPQVRDRPHPSRWLHEHLLPVASRVAARIGFGAEDRCQ